MSAHSRYAISHEERPTPPWRFCYSDEVKEWLATPHQQKKIALQLQSKIKHAFLRVSADGTMAGKKFISKIATSDALWEVRIGHDTAAYRIFCTPRPGRVLVMGRVIAKKKQSLSAREYKEIEEQVLAFAEKVDTSRCS